MLSFDADGTLRKIEEAADAAALDALEQVEFYNGILVPADLLNETSPLETLFDRPGRTGPAGFEVGSRPGAVLIEGIDWQRLRPSAQSSVRRIL